MVSVTHIPRKGIVRPQSQFPHSWVCEMYAYIPRISLPIVLQESMWHPKYYSCPTTPTGTSHPSTTTGASCPNTKRAPAAPVYKLSSAALIPQLAAAASVLKWHQLPRYPSCNWHFLPKYLNKHALLCTATKIPIMCSFPGNCAASAPISTFMCLWVIYIFGCSKIDRPILEIYKSLIDIWM